MNEMQKTFGRILSIGNLRLHHSCLLSLHKGKTSQKQAKDNCERASTTIQNQFSLRMRQMLALMAFSTLLSASYLEREEASVAGLGLARTNSEGCTKEV